LNQLAKDAATGASAATIRQDTQPFDADSRALVGVERAFAEDSVADAAP
jgi:hypothetical protein